MRRHTAAAVIVSLLSTIAATPVAAQTLKEQVNNLFRFGECGEALCLAVNADVHGLHYAPSATVASGALLNFFADNIGAAVSNLPISSSSGGVTYSFSGGRPVKTSTSSGPIFAERGQTIGRGQLLAGANVTSLSFATFRGLPLNQLNFNFTHQNVGSPTYGDPVFENDIISVQSDLNLNVFVTTAFMTYGLLDKLDVGVAVPLVRTSLSGTSSGTIQPFSASTPHFFGTDANRSLTASGSTSASSIGIGDIAVRVKANVSQTDKAGIALFGDVRLPTGNADNFRGAGSLSSRLLGAYSGRYGNFSPHVNAGMLIRTDSLQNNAGVAIVGFDQLINDSWTLAVDLLSEYQIGENKVALPDPVQLTAPFNRSIIPTNIPGTKDHVVSGSLGAKFTTSSGLTTVLNALIPIKAGGLQSRVAFTAGVEFSF
jgi:hypothetical protein